jgi:predicted DNA-binding ribbon-helix-helix protein
VKRHAPVETEGAPVSKMQKSRPKRGRLKSQNVKRSVTIGHRKTSVTLEQTFWDGLKEIAAARDVPFYRMITEIVQGQINRSSALRVFVLNFYRQQIQQDEKRDSAALDLGAKRARAKAPA